MKGLVQILNIKQNKKHGFVAVEALESEWRLRLYICSLKSNTRLEKEMDPCNTH